MPFDWILLALLAVLLLLTLWLVLRRTDPSPLQRVRDELQTSLRADVQSLERALRDEVAQGRVTADASGRLLVTRNQLYALLDAVRATHRDKWGQQGSSSTEKLLREILSDWRGWGAAVEIGEFWQLEALLSRFHAYYHDPSQPPLERAAGRRRRKT